MNKNCPGSANVRTPTLELKKCPQCGSGVEIFSDETSVRCAACGFTIYRDLASCIKWCRYAEECVGPERYRELISGDKENTGR